MFASILGHIGDGNFHESIMYDKTNAEEVEKIERVVHNMIDRALLMEGTCTVRSRCNPIPAITQNIESGNRANMGWVWGRSNTW